MQCGTKSILFAQRSSSVPELMNCQFDLFDCQLFLMYQFIAELKIESEVYLLNISL